LKLWLVIAASTFSGPRRRGGAGRVGHGEGSERRVAGGSGETRAQGPRAGARYSCGPRVDPGTEKRNPFRLRRVSVSSVGAIIRYAKGGGRLCALMRNTGIADCAPLVRSAAEERKAPPRPFFQRGGGRSKAAGKCENDLGRWFNSGHEWTYFRGKTRERPC